MNAYRSISLWHETAGDDLVPRAALPGSATADVAIVGAGFTGLWTAYYLKRAQPDLGIMVLEGEVAGFGASGRNGGWLSDLFPSSEAKLAALPGSSREQAIRMRQAMRNTIDEVGAVTAEEGIDCHFHKGGTLVFARSKSQLRRARAEVAAAREWGGREEDLRLLTADEATALARASRVLGATYSPHCARIHPARLARGLADTVSRMGVVLHEQTTALSIEPGAVRTEHGTVRAEVVVRATEGFTPGLAGEERAMVPVYSLIVATERLSPDVWNTIGLADRPTFADHRHLTIYGQRTADDRLVFGGRGAPYHFGSAIKPSFDRDPGRIFAGLRETLVDLFPALGDVAFTHEWGGPIGIPRDWMASVGLDRRTGLGWAGGYVGDGVSTTNLAGRTLADLITGVPSELTTLPWVNHRSRRWEPEPLRWLAINAGLRTMSLADREERITGRASVLAKAMAPFLGGH